MSYWSTKLKIKNLEVSRFIGGPLDGITDSPFRKLVREFSKDNLLYSEMRHVSCVAHDKSGHKSLKFDIDERPINYQFAANSLNDIELACAKVIAKGVDMIDLNIGCPARNVVSSGSGSALMADPDRLKLIVSKLRDNLSDIPFTVKMRAGFKEKNAIDIAKLLQDCGVDAIAIHPRLQTELFAGRPDYELAKKVKESVSVPVILSGNVVNFKTAKLAYESTGVDGFLIGRGIWGRPWKLKEMEINAMGGVFEISLKDTIGCAIKHFEYMLDYYGKQAVFIFRKHLPFYLKGFEGASALREKIMSSSDQDFVKRELENLYNSL